MPSVFDNVYLHSSAMFLPGEAIDNQAMDSYIAPLNRLSGRIKARILNENGIQSRHYAINTEGQTTISHAQMAAQAIRDCLLQGQVDLSEVGLLSVGSSGGDALMPGFANMIQGELAAPAMQTASLQGVCAAGVAALDYAAHAVQNGNHRHALAVTAEMPSRMFKRSRFAPRDYESDFDAHFLRWMLSDGAGALLLGQQARALQPGLGLQLKWIHQQSFSGDYPVCMQLGLSADRQRSFLDYDSASAAEADGALSLRQDIRLLPHLFDVCIHEYVKLVQDGWINSDQIDHFLCHYSSAKFAPVVKDLLDKAGMSIPDHKWYSNLQQRGNTGAASIYIMLHEFLQTHTLQAGQKIFCFVPESGRMTAAYILLEVVPVSATSTKQPLATQGLSAMHRRQSVAQTSARTDSLANAIAAPHDPASAKAVLRPLLTELASLWQDYRSAVWRSPLLQKITRQQFTQDDYRNWTAQWVPQVREGSLWMRQAVASLTTDYAALAALISQHAGDEQNDFQILYQNYQAAGGELALDDLRRNPGGEALNAYLHRLAKQTNPVGLLGAIYIIEGTGQRIVPALLPLLRQQLDLPASAFAFLSYHGENDQHHLERWLHAVEIVLNLAPEAASAIMQTTKRTAQLYLMQFEDIL